MKNLIDKEKAKKWLTDEYYQHKQVNVKKILSIADELEQIADKHLTAAGYEQEIRQYVVLLRLEYEISQD